MTFLAGLGLGLSLIVAIGAQNVFVLRQGLRRERVGLVVAICAASDLVLIAAGVAGLGAAVTAISWLESAARWAGAAFLLGYGVLAARRAIWPQGQVLQSDARTPGSGGSGDGGGVGGGAGPGAGGGARRGALGVAATTLALTWLNPHVYLDTVLLLGSVAASHGDGRWLFAAGAGLGSVLWFSALGFGSRLLGGLLARPGAWRVLDGGIALVMWLIALGLVLGA